jgi:hypothetical protein
VTAPYVESCLLGNVSEIPTSLDQLWLTIKRTKTINVIGNSYYI